MSGSEDADDVPQFELAPDDYFDDNDPRQRRDEEEIDAAYLRRLFENYSEPTIREVLGEEYDRKRREYEAVRKGAESALNGSRLEKAHAPDDWLECDSALLEAHEKAVQWKADQPLDEYDISKAPGVWESSDQVPDWVIEALEELIRAGNVVWQGGYERLPPSAEARIQQILEDRLTQPQGFSLDSLLDDLKDAFPNQEDEYLLNILRNETSALLNTAREEAYELRDDADEYLFSWDGPVDHRTTDTCLAIEDRIEDEGGAVPMDQLKQILYEEALAHSDDEGTPERVDDWVPHHNCRRTFTRRVQSI